MGRFCNDTTSRWEQSWNFTFDHLFDSGRNLFYNKNKGATASFVSGDGSGVDGKEVSQVYVKDVFATVARPEKELKGFSKDLVKSGETVRVTVPLNARSFAYYNTAMKKWMVENGEFEILICSSSREVRLKASIFIDLPEETQQAVYYLD